MSFHFKFTVFTPTYNSSSCIELVFRSLSDQTFRDFEWLVVDDCSTDNTVDVLTKMQAEARFPIRIIRNQENRMLMYNYNLASQRAQGELFLPAGHDDEFDCTALAVLNSAWEGIPTSTRTQFSGISCLCKYPDGRIVGDSFPRSPWDSDIFEQIYNHKIRGEKWGFTRTQIMREFPFPSYDRYIPEALIWYRMGAKYKTRFINEALRTYHHSEAASHLSNSLMKYPLGRFEYYLEIVNNYLHRMWGRPLRILGYVAMIDFFGRATGKSWLEIFKRLLPTQRALWVFMTPTFWLTRYLIVRRSQ